MKPTKPWPDPPPETTQTRLLDDLAAMGIASQHVLVHSSYKLLAPAERGPRGVLDALVEVVGTDGSLLLPTYDFSSWTERGYWAKENTPSQMGVISELARNDSRFERTSHPVLSYAVSGDVYEESKPTTMYHNPGSFPYPGMTEEYRYGYLLDQLNAHGPGSIFDVLVRNNGLILSIGANHQTGFRPNDVGFTISNHAAVLAGAPWRRTKIFEGLYCTGGYCAIKRYALSVNADPTRYTTEVTPAHLRAEKEGVITRSRLGNTECWVTYAKEFVAWAVESHKTSPGLWRREL